MSQSSPFVSLETAMERIIIPDSFVIHVDNPSDFGATISNLELALAERHDVDMSTTYPDERLLSFALNSTWSSMTRRFAKIQTSAPTELFATVDLSDTELSKIGLVLPLSITKKVGKALGMEHGYHRKTVNRREGQRIMLGKTVVSDGIIENPYFEPVETAQVIKGQITTADRIAGKARSHGRLSGGPI